MNIVLMKKGMEIISIVLVFIIILINVQVKGNSPDNYEYSLLSEDIEGVHESPSIAVYNNYVYVVWNTIQNEYTTSSIYYTKSSDYGKNWSTPKKISANSTSAYSPSIAVYNGTIHVAWQDFITDNPEIFYIKSSDNGVNWEKPKRLTYNSTRKTNIYDISIKANKNNVYLTWKDYRTGSSEIFFKKSIDDGDNWLSDQRLTIDHTPSYYPSLDMSGKKLFIAYQDGGTSPNICFLKSMNNGVNWTEKEYITSHTEAIASEKPQIFVYDQIIFLTWQDDRTGNEEIFFTSSSDDGKTWKKSMQLTNNQNSDLNPTIYADKKNIIIAWVEEQNSTLGVSTISSNDYGETWGLLNRLKTKNDCYDPKITGTNETIQIVWQEYNGDISEIWHMTYTENENNYNNIEDKNGKTSGFEILSLICIINIFIFMKYFKKKKEGLK